MTRGFLRSVCRALIGVVLLAQMAVAAYACPGLASGSKMNGVMDLATPADTAMDQQAADCAGMAGPMDPEFANLCAEHCRHGQQSDQAATLTVPSALLNALYTTPPAPEPAVALRPAADTVSARAAASPTLAIRHCCFRI